MSDALPCGSNGVCIDGLNTFECTCNDGFDGIPCEPIVMNGKVLYDDQIIILICVLIQQRSILL